MYISKNNLRNTYKWNLLVDSQFFVSFKLFLDPILKETKELFDSSYKGDFVFDLLNLPFTVTQHLTLLDFNNTDQALNFLIEPTSSVYSAVSSLKQKDLEELCFDYVYDGEEYDFFKTSFKWSATAPDRGSSILSEDDEQALQDFAVAKLFSLSHSIEDDHGLEVEGKVTFNFLTMVLSLTEECSFLKEKSFTFVVAG